MDQPFGPKLCSIFYDNNTVPIDVKTIGTGYS